MAGLVAKDPASPFPAMIRKCQRYCCCCCGKGSSNKRSKNGGYEMVGRLDEDADGGDDESIYSQAMDEPADVSPPSKGAWLRSKLPGAKKPEPVEEQEAFGPFSAAGSGLDRFGGGNEGEWVVGALRFPDTGDARQATKAHVLLCVATLLVGELCPLFLSLPSATVTAAEAGGEDGSLAGGGRLVSEKSGSGGGGGGSVGLGVGVGAVAAVGALTSLAAATLRKYLGRQLEVSSPWVPLKVAAVAAVVAALLWPALGSVRLGAESGGRTYDVVLCKHTSYLHRMRS